MGLQMLTKSLQKSVSLSVSHQTASRLYSVMSRSDNFYSLASASEFETNHNRDIRANNQGHIIIDSDPFENVQKIDFVFQNMRVTISLGTFEYLMKF